MKNVFIRAAVAGAVSLFSASAAFAGVIDVQFSAASASRQQAGAAVIGAGGDYWNYFSAASGTSNLVNTAQAATGVSVTFAATGAYTAGPTAFTSTPYAKLMQGYLFTSGSGINLTLNGLLAAQRFDLYFYTQGDNSSAGRSSNVTVNGVSQVSTQTNASTFIQGNNYLLFSGAATSGGSVVIGVSNRNGEANVNGFQLLTTVVPEPSTLVLIGAGLISLCFLQRRRPKDNGAHKAASTMALKA